MSTIKPIETIYNGYRFRSRLEARWAVFFDTLGVQYIYEREGFDLGGIWYLPDFWLPDLNCWVEIKGNPTPESSTKAFALAKHTGKLVFMFSDCLPPEIKTIYDEEDGSPDVIIRNYGIYYAPDGDRDGMISFGFCSFCKIATLGHSSGHQVFCNEAYEIFNGTCEGEEYGIFVGNHVRVDAAYTAARQARFE